MKYVFDVFLLISFLNFYYSELMLTPSTLCNDEKSFYKIQKMCFNKVCFNF